MRAQLLARFQVMEADLSFQRQVMLEGIENMKDQNIMTVESQVVQP